MPAILSTCRGDAAVRRYCHLPGAFQCQYRARHRPALDDTRSVRMHAWHFPMLEIASEAVTDALSIASDASDALASSSASTAASSLPPEVLVAAGAAAVAVGALVFAAGKKDSGSEVKQGGGSPGRGRKQKREDCVLVFGASGRSGKACVQALLASGRSVVAACRSAADLGIKAGKQKSGAVLFLETGVDVTKADSIKSSLFEGVTQVVITSAATPAPGGQGFAEGQDPESVDATGVENVVKRAVEVLPGSTRSVKSFMEGADFATWEARNDTVMGGTSSSAITVAEGTSVAEWKGELVVENGGFCGVTSTQSFDLSAFDGISLRVKGGGETCKVNLKTPSQDDKPLDVYQATFDTVAGEWVRVNIPWHEFVAVSRAQVKLDAEPLDTSQISTVGLVYSRFDFNGYPNPNCKPGSFSLEIDGGLSGYTDPRPALIQVSSASTERNTLIGSDAEARAADIPIVQLNPAGIMNWKYKGECAVRASGLPYSLLRPTGLVGDTDPDEGKPYAVELCQGDSVSGRVSRDDLASVVVQAASEAAAVNTTFEIKRTERWALGGQVVFDGQVPKSEWLRLVQDRDRHKVGLLPLPAFVPPPDAVTEERKKEILADPRVQTVAAREKGGDAESVRSSSLTPEAASAVRKEAVQQWIDAYRARAPAAAEEVAAPVVDEAAAAEIEQRKKEAQAWITAWRSAPPPAAPAASSNGADPAASASADDIAARKAEAQAWIDSWRAASPSAPSAQDEARAWIANWRAGSAANTASKKTGAKVKVGAR